MNVLDSLIACAGSWRGRNILHDPNTGKPEDTPGTATIAPVIGDRWVRLSYTWGYQRKPQEGFMLLGLDKTEGLVAHWVDSWHQGREVMHLTGPKPTGATLILNGIFPAPPDPDWGWRIEITPAADKLRVTMHCIEPSGKEIPGAEAEYERAG